MAIGSKANDGSCPAAGPTDLYPTARMCRRKLRYFRGDISDGRLPSEIKPLFPTVSAVENASVSCSGGVDSGGG